MINNMITVTDVIIITIIRVTGWHADFPLVPLEIQYYTYGFLHWLNRCLLSSYHLQRSEMTEIETSVRYIARAYL